MNMFIIFLLIAVLAEVLRRFFLYKMLHLAKKKRHIVGSLLIIGAIVGSTFLGYRGLVIVSILLGILSVLIDTLIINSALPTKPCPNNKEKRDNRASWRILYCSYLLPLILLTGSAIMALSAGERDFEEAWNQTAEVTITESPDRVILNQNEKIILENSSEEDFVISLNDDNLPLLKLQKGDKLRYLRIGMRHRTEITMLEGKPCQIIF